MDTIVKLVAHLRSIWDRGSRGFRAALVASAIFVTLTMGGVGYWASRPQYMPLASDLTPAEAARIMEKLDSANIPYQKSFSASIIYVPQRMYSDATVAIKDVMGPLLPDDESATSSIWDPDMKKERVIRQKERALATSILRMPSIASADVHIAMPDGEIFYRERKPAKASVLIGMRRGESLAPEQAATIANLVASSVEGLAPENVTVTDSEGHTIYPDASVADHGLSRQYHFKRQLEADLVAKAETILAQMLGPNHAVVRVFADIDFTETERVETRIDKVNSTKRKEEVTTKEEKGAVDAAAGAAGTSSNLSAANTRTASPMSKKEETIVTEWDNPASEDTVRQYGGTIKRLTIAAAVNLPQPDPNANPPVAALDIKQIEQIIQNAVGYDSTRDTISVVPATLPGTGEDVVAVVETLNRWDFYNNLVKNASLGLAAVVALVLGILLIRKLQPMQAIRSNGATEANVRSNVLDELSAQAKQNPEIVSKIVAAWLNTPTTIPMPQEDKRRTEPAPARTATRSAA